MFREKLDALKDLYVYTIHELKVVKILVEVVNVTNSWLSGISNSGLHVLAGFEEAYDTKKLAKAALRDLIEAERAKLNAAEDDLEP